MATTHLDLVPDGTLPIVGLGTWQVSGDELEKALDIALEIGYRHIDTAYFYQNENVIGKVLNRWISSGKLQRSDLFVVTKLPPIGMRYNMVAKFLKKSLELLQLDYVDLYLIHLPFGFKNVNDQLLPLTPEGTPDFDNDTDHVGIWKGMEEQVDAGLTKAIGLSNFNIKQITRILDNSRIPPCNLQVELHAYHQQKKLVDFCRANNITVTSYCTLGSPAIQNFYDAYGARVNPPNLLGDPVVKKIGQKHNKSTAQILLKHLVQKGIAVIPKSVHGDRLEQNFGIFDFILSENDMSKLNALDTGKGFIDLKLFKGVENHPEYPFKG